MNYFKKMNKNNEIEELSILHMTDKNKNGHYYTQWYNLYFSPFKTEKLNLLEIGILGGASVKMWRDFFVNSNIYAIDISPEVLQHVLTGIDVTIGDATNSKVLDSVIEKTAEGLDIIIDDGSHYTSDQIISFEYLFPKLNSGGIYVIEDLMTSYWKGKDGYPHGVAPGHGNPNFETQPYTSAVDYLKSRVDDALWNGKAIYNNYQNLPKEVIKDLTKMELDIEAIHFYAGICFIFKR